MKFPLFEPFLVSSQWNVVTTCQSPFATSPESRRRVHRPSVCDGTGRRPHCNLVILHQLSVYGKQPELFYLTGCTADTPAHQHVELHLFSLVETDEACHVQCPEERDHWHGCIHPQPEGCCAGSFLGIYFYGHTQLGIKWSTKIRCSSERFTFISLKRIK